ncbi:MAG: hypothetical protein SWH78_06000 [Thermodesulfobacteriota bacterium]|nr:hypothetical protein [Thermodesulfobacteriota bacterium]
MSKIPKEPREVFSDITSDYKALFADDLVSIILYGSAASGEYMAGKSDINFMIVLSDNGIDSLERTFEVIKKWKKRKVATPLFLTEDYIRTSLDAFPIEYLNFQNCHQLVYGKDILKDLTFDRDYVRLQCERDIKGKLLLLREAFLETGGKGKDLQELVAHSVHAFVAVFNGLLYLKGKEVPRRKRDAVAQVCDTFDLEKALFEKLLDIREKKITLSATEMAGVFQAYLKQVRNMWKQLDRLDTE